MSSNGAAVPAMANGEERKKRKIDAVDGVEGGPASQRHFTEYFTDPEVDNLRIESIKAVIYPQLLMEEIPNTPQGKRTVQQARQAVSDILNGKDDRLVVVVGPCSIHDAKAAIEYGTRLKAEATRLSKDLLILMRVYFEKPRTTVGWKGLINDPHLDESYDINHGLKIGRRILADINNMELPCACEFLDTMIPQYIADLVAWAAIGARTTESQLHRQLASGLSMPVGFKNATSGDIQVAIDAVRSAQFPHSFLSITKQGLPAIVLSMGNKDTHVVLRGGATGPNYASEHIQGAADKLTKNKVVPKVMVDCSHGNSQKDHNRQPKVAEDICSQLSKGEMGIMGVMIESHLFEGKQDLPTGDKLSDIINNKNDSPTTLHGSGPGQLGPEGQRSTVLSSLRYGVSVTDACIHWMDTVKVLENLAAAVRQRREAVAKK